MPSNSKPISEMDRINQRWYQLKFTISELREKLKKEHETTKK